MYQIYVVSVSTLVRKFRQQSREQMEERRPNLVEALNRINDFYMELKWDFQSWGESKIIRKFKMDLHYAVSRQLTTVLAIIIKHEWKVETVLIFRLA